MEGVGGSTVEAQRIAKAQTQPETKRPYLYSQKNHISVEMRKRSLSLVLYGRKTRVTCVVVVSTLKAEDVILRSNNGICSPMKPTCCLCFKPYCPDFMYIRCERCRNWFHGDALELEEARIIELISYRCCRCRRRALPKCPHSDRRYYKNPVDTLSSEEAVGTADDGPLLASFGRVEPTIKETIDADSSMNMDSFVQGSNQEINFMDGSSHSAHPVAKVEHEQVAKAELLPTTTKSEIGMFGLPYITSLLSITNFCRFIPEPKKVVNTKFYMLPLYDSK